MQQMLLIATQYPFPALLLTEPPMYLREAKHLTKILPFIASLAARQVHTTKFRPGEKQAYVF